MDVKNKICFICGGLSGGGQERALTNWANEFANEGVEISIICLFKTEIFYQLNPIIKVIWPSLDRKTTNKFIYAIKLIPFIRKNVKQIKPDIVISFGDWFNAYSIIATRFLGVKTFITNRMGPNLFLGKFLELFNRLSYPFADGLIVQTNRAKEILAKKYSLKKIHVIPNILKPIDIDNLTYENNIISIGRLSKEKGHSILIEAFSKLQIDSYKLHLIGDGPEMNNLKEYVKILNIENKVIFHGHQKNFTHVLQKASIFVLPSFYEGFPNALLEAMSIPLACISSDCVAGPREIIQHNKNGLLFETRNVKDLFNKLNFLVSNKEQQIIFRNEAYKVRNKYSSEQIFKLIKKSILEN
jgi:GalNAc-alpha-(1->4)-GalNAc-alpha-(1->3)-diNAcBac-PP-undecaprenol alpha-1,4-N-acetyl-D-galactosaminyltransferase